MASNRRKCEFAANVSSNCFLCQQKTRTVKYQSLLPLKCICRYLNINLSKFHSLRSEGTSLPIFEKGGTRDRDVQVTLCEECGLLSGKFVKLYRDLEAIKMKLSSCLGALDERMRMFGKGSPEVLIRRGNLGRNRPDNDSSGLDRKAQLEMGSKPMLRREIMLKYQLYNKRSQPRIRINDVLLNQQGKKIKLNLESTSGSLAPNLDKDKEVRAHASDNKNSLSQVISVSDRSTSLSGRGTNLNEMTRDNWVRNRLPGYPNSNNNQNKSPVINPPQPKPKQPYLLIKQNQSKLSKPYSCKLCRASFPTARGLRHHHDAMHLANPPVTITRKLVVDESSGSRSRSSDDHRQSKSARLEIRQPKPEPLVAVEITSLNIPLKPQQPPPFSSLASQESHGPLKVPCFICKSCDRTFMDIKKWNRHVKYYCGSNGPKNFYLSIQRPPPTSTSHEGPKLPEELGDSHISQNPISIKYEPFDNDNTPNWTVSELLQTDQEPDFVTEPDSQPILDNNYFLDDNDEERKPCLF